MNLKGMFLLVIMIALAMGFSAAAWAKSDSTVISLFGEAWQKGALADQWRPLRTGDTVPEGAWVKTDRGGSLRIVDFLGNIVMIPENQKQQIGANIKTNKKTAVGFFAVLKEMFSQDKRKRIAASRSPELAGTSAGNKRVLEFYENSFRGLLRKPRMETSDIDLVFAVASYFQEPELKNRAVALMIKLSQDFPNRTGFSVLAAKAVSEFGQKARLEVFKRVEGKVLPVKQDETLKSGYGVQLRYIANTESYIYLFLHTVPENGKPTTSRVYPAVAGSGWTLAGNQTLSLPLEDAYFTLDERTGREYLYGWSCTGPVLDQSREKKSVKDVTEKIQKTGTLDSETVLAVAPPLCTQGYAYAFNHQ